MKTETEMVIDEIREGRRRLSEQFGHDPAKYVAYLKALDQKHKTQIGQFLTLRTPPAATKHAPND